MWAGRDLPHHFCQLRPEDLDFKYHSSQEPLDHTVGPKMTFLEFQIFRTSLISVHNMYMNVYVIVRFQYQCSEIYDIRSANKDEVKQGIIICGS